jgi:acyl-CoA thioester hydrolase
MTAASKGPGANSTTVVPATGTVVAGPAPPIPMARVPMTVRWGDLDAFNHVNNATFLVYAQEARLAWLAGIDGPWFDQSMMPVVAAAQVNFRRQLAWPSRIAVELAAKRLGTSSLTISHRIVADDDSDCTFADGEVVMVWIDPASGRSVPLPPAIRAACQSEASGASTSK